MLFTIIITILFTTMKILYTDGLETTPSVSIILDGFTLQTWIDKALSNKTAISIVHHLNENCDKDPNCDAEYGIENIHIIDIIQSGSTSIRLNVTVDEPVVSSDMKFDNASPSVYNYTTLLTGALYQAKNEMEGLYGPQSLYSSTYSHQNSVTNRTTRLLFVLLGIILVALVFGLTVLFFQRIRRHSYSKLLKPIRTCPPTQDEFLTNSPSMSASRQ